MLGTEGARRYAFTVRNVGTAPCRAAQVAVGGAGRRVGTADAVHRAAGPAASRTRSTSASARAPSRARAPRSSSRRRRRGRQAGRQRRRDARRWSSGRGTRTRARPIAGRRFSGTAQAGQGAGVRKRTLPVARVQIAVRRVGKGVPLAVSAAWRAADGRRPVPGASATTPCGCREGHDAWRLNLRKAAAEGRVRAAARARCWPTASPRERSAGRRQERLRFRRALRHDTAIGQTSSLPRAAVDATFRPDVAGSPLRARGLVVLSDPRTAASRASADLNDPADQWLPRTDGASGRTRGRTATTRRRRGSSATTIQSRAAPRSGCSWDEHGRGRLRRAAAAGTIDFQHTDAGLVNLNYQSTQPPPQFPILCASATDCGNSVAGALLHGHLGHALADARRADARRARAGARWAAPPTTSPARNRYVGHEKVKVAGVPGGRRRRRRSTPRSRRRGRSATRSAAATRTVWWVRGVGPVRVVLRHASGETERGRACARRTLKPLPLPSDVNLLPLNRGDVAHVPLAQHQAHEEVVDAALRGRRRGQHHRARGRQARLGPIGVAGELRVRHAAERRDAALGGATRRDQAKFPELGPRGVPPTDRRRFFTPFDLMVYGFNPIVPVYPAQGRRRGAARATAATGAIFGVTGKSTLAGTQTVKRPARASSRPRRAARR